MSLIERLEDAEMGDFGLDSDVHVGLNLTVPRLDGLKSTTLPPVTTSLDAALALAERVLPDETFWEVNHISVVSGVKMYHAEVFVPFAGVDVDNGGFAASPALALCIAILKAKETK